ncbi:MAG: class I SAM-dependent methyltransferase [Actinomycetota bacterium]|nr:class I SAM-dependent methyltransferase [Actinomycetota bacterium]
MTEFSNDSAEQKEIWTKYFAATDNQPVHPMFHFLDPLMPHSGRAIDLGCGAGRGSVWLLEHGLQTIAVDISQEALDHLEAKLPPDADIQLIRSSFQDLDLAALGPFDVIVAAFTLFFLPPDDYPKFWRSLVQTLKPAGLFAGQFLGVNDSWSDQGLTIHDRAAVEELLQPFEVLLLEEEEKDGPTALGDIKHWHAFHVIARKN